jgi:hypothetical protein
MTSRKIGLLSFAAMLPDTVSALIRTMLRRGDVQLWRLAMLRFLRWRVSLSLCLLLCGSSPHVSAQALTPGINAPGFLPSPAPQIQPLAVPQYGVVSQPNPATLSQNSFSNRVTQCLQIGASAGLGPATNGMYSADCASQ